MPAAVFILHLDEMQGFVVEKRFPSTFSLNERILNLVYYGHHEQPGQEVQLHNIDGRRIVTFGTQARPDWLACFVLSDETDFGPNKEVFAGMGRLMLELAAEDPKLVDVGEIVRRRQVIPAPSQEQRCAATFTSPSSTLVLERLEELGLERSARLAIWLRDEIHAQDVNLADAVRPLMDAEIVAVEMFQKTTEVVYLLADVFAYRAPPVEALRYAEENMPDVAEQYAQLVKEFFSPDPPAKGYNPTIPVDDPNSPIVEDRRTIAGLLTKSLLYTVIRYLRERPQTASEISQTSILPERIVNRSLWELETERVAARLDDGMWVLVTDPRIEVFMPEFVLPIVARRVSEKEIGAELGKRYLELLTEKWSESR